ncbi:uncharacterized protein LOC127723899 [Mytilus californianus]|uniref:uncharacterized protein LOC127723899 n=1 Tax=Mytilus californianus TaxID=6549 RepID=UPI002247EFA6|nr:uncharacterized protein LOC127723899 [Mytilus californianus]
MDRRTRYEKRRHDKDHYRWDNNSYDNPGYHRNNDICRPDFRQKDNLHENINVFDHKNVPQPHQEYLESHVYGGTQRTGSDQHFHGSISTDSISKPKSWKAIAVAIGIVLLVVVAGAIAIAVYFTSLSDVHKKTVSPTTTPVPPQELKFQGNITIDNEWDEGLTNRSSAVYKQKAANVSNMIDKVYQSSDLKDIYLRNEVEGFRQGSTEVIIDIIFKNPAVVKEDVSTAAPPVVKLDIKKVADTFVESVQNGVVEEYNDVFDIDTNTVSFADITPPATSASQTTTPTTTTPTTTTPTTTTRTTTTHTTTTPTTTPTTTTHTTTTPTTTPTTTTPITTIPTTTTPTTITSTTTMPTTTPQTSTTPTTTTPNTTTPTTTTPTTTTPTTTTPTTTMPTTTTTTSPTTTTQTSTMTTVSIESLVVFYVQVFMRNMTWIPAYNDTGSAEYQNMLQTVNQMEANLRQQMLSMDSSSSMSETSPIAQILYRLVFKGVRPLNVNVEIMFNLEFKGRYAEKSDGSQVMLDWLAIKDILSAGLKIDRDDCIITDLTPMTTIAVKDSTPNTTTVMPNTTFWQPHNMSSTTKSVNLITPNTTTVMPNTTFWQPHNISSTTKSVNFSTPNTTTAMPNTTFWQPHNISTTTKSVNISTPNTTTVTAMPNTTFWQPHNISTTTSSSVPNGTVIFSVQLLMINMTWIPAYNDTSSPEYQLLMLEIQQVFPILLSSVVSPLR